MYDSVSKVFEIGMDVICKIKDTQSEKIDAAGRLIAQTHMDGHKFFVTGSGHSHMVTEEFYGRAGGLAFPVPIMTTELTLEEHPNKSSYIERLPGYAPILGELYGVGAGDVIVVASNSGRNAYPVEIALYAKEHGAKVIAITNVDHSSKTSSRHASGKKLMDLADILIDNCGIEGDSAMQLEGMRASICPTSTMASAFIVQAIIAACCDEMLKAGQEPPVFMSLNSDGTEKVNDELFAKYTRQYK